VPGTVDHEFPSDPSLPDGQQPARAHIIIEAEQMTEAMKECGLTLLEVGDEGTICLNNQPCHSKPFFSGTYFGEVGVYEIVAAKKEIGED
jgi:hypothetical protein